MHTMSLPRRIVQARLGGRVERCHGIPHHGSYSVARHSWGVAMLMLMLWPKDFPRLAGHCLSHDVPEAWVGDVPAPVKRYVPGLRESMQRMEDRISASLDLPIESDLTGDDARKLRSCDHLELYLWGCEEIAMGNYFVREMLHELGNYFEETPLLEPAQQMFRYFREYWRAGTLSEVLTPTQAQVVRDLQK